MTDAQIKQNAFDEAVNYSSLGYEQTPFADGYIAGAHSRDEEISKLKRLYEEVLHKYYEAECKLRNLWISVEKQLPVENQDILISHWNENVTHINCVSTSDINYIKEHPDLIKYWMLTPKVKRNESK